MVVYVLSLVVPALVACVALGYFAHRVVRRCRR